MSCAYYPPPQPDNARTIEEAIGKIRDSPTEHIYLFKHHKQIFHFEGDNSKVVIDSKYLLQFKDGTIVHNHPGGSSFSIEDVVGVIANNATEIILVTNTHTYHLKRPGPRWMIDPLSDRFRQQLEVCRNFAKTELEKLVSNRSLSEPEKDVEIFHYIWMFFFEMNGIEYGRTKITKLQKAI